ncbi:hypothetical protein AAG906_039197 [Vitis piasezkii]
MEPVSLVRLISSIARLIPTLRVIQDILTNMDEEQLDLDVMQNWIKDLKDAAYDAEDLAALGITPRGMNFCKIRSQFNTKKLNERFDHIRQNANFIRCVVPIEGGRTSIPVPPEMSTEGGRTSISFPPDMSTIVGREDDKEEIVQMLLKRKYDTEVGIRVIRIVGMTGMGKTTLAQLVYLDARVVKRFKENRIWVCVTVNFDLSRILRDIMMRSNPNINHTNSSLNQLYDVWTDNDEEWKRLLYLLQEGAKQSRVLATSQMTEVCHVQYMQITHNLGFLSFLDCWSLFKRTAFGHDDCPSQLVDSGTTIVRNCQNLPLAVKAMASFLGRNLDPKKWRRISELDIWEAEKGSPNLPAPAFSCDETEDLIQFQGQKRIEELAGEYFNELLTRSFFQSPDVDRKRYRMHDLFHNLAQSISGPYSCLVKEDNTQYDFSEQTRHVSLMCRNVEKPVLDMIDKSKKVRTLLLPSNYLTDFGQALDKRFGRMKYIRVLDLSSSTILDVPNSIQELKLLRYLNLSKTEIRSLPAFLCKLHNLQTLLLLGCLINLRHLELDEVFWHKTTKLPPRIGSLTSLQNLHAFPVWCGDGYGIKELKGMAKLTGSLRISNLENAVKAGEAKLNEKKALINLYGQLQNLVTVSLKYCERCKALSLGALPHLQKLNIKGMQELEELQQSGEYPSLASLKISCNSLKVLAVTPFLKVLVLVDNIVLEDLNKAKCSFFSLLELKIYGCPKLEALPQIFTPKKVEIGGCKLLRALPAPESCQQLQHLLLDECEDGTLLGTIPKTSSLNSLSLTSLKDLYIKDCPKLSSLPKEGVSISLQHLVIQGCPILVERCTEDDGGGPDWGKIKDITDREIGSTEVSSSLDLSNQIQDHPKASSTRWHHPFVKYWKESEDIIVAGANCKGKESAEQ